MGIAEAIEAEIENLEAKAEKLREVLADVFSIDGGSKRDGRKGPRKGKLSRTARARISAAQRKRWTGKRVNKSKRRKMSAAARKRLSELLKQRWAAGTMGKRKAK